MRTPPFSRLLWAGTTTDISNRWLTNFARQRCSSGMRLLTAAGRGVFVRPGPERVRGDGQGLGAGGVSVNAPHRTVAVSWRGESRYWCCGCRACCCCDSPTGSCAHRCSSCRRVSPGWCLLCPWPKKRRPQIAGVRLLQVTHQACH